MKPPPPPQLPVLTNTESIPTDSIPEDLTTNPIEDESEPQTPVNTELVVMTDSLELTNTASHSPLSNHSSEQIQDEPINLTPPTPQAKQEESEQVNISSRRKISTKISPFRNKLQQIIKHV